MEFKELLFIIYRIMPFIIVAFLVISSLFSGELSGFLVLVGIIISSLITIGISQTDFVKNVWAGKETELLKCSLITLNHSVLSYLPLSTHTFAFIFGYFLYAITSNSLVASNGMFIAIITLLLGFDMYYNFNNCVTGLFALIPAIVGVFSGVIWAAMIGKENQMVPQADPGSKCSMTKGMYKCKIKRTGQVVS